MPPPPEDPTTRRQALHQVLIEGDDNFRLALPPFHRLPYGGKVAFSCRSACKVKVQEKKYGGFLHWSGWLGGVNCLYHYRLRHPLHISCKGLDGLLQQA